MANTTPLNAVDIQNMQTTFTQNYNVNGQPGICPALFAPINDISNFINAVALPPLQKACRAIKFIPCLDPHQGFYLQMQIGTMYADGPIGGIYDFSTDFSANHNYNLINNTIQDISGAPLPVVPFNNFFANTIFIPSGQHLSDAPANTFTNYVVFGWETELNQVILQNPGNTNLVITCAAVGNPATLTFAMFITNEDNTNIPGYINSINNPVNIFQAKGCDMVNPCPPKCQNIYTAPLDLNAIIDQL